MRRAPVPLGSWMAALMLASFASGAAACSQCLCGSPTPPDFLLGDQGRGARFGLEDLYLSKRTGLEEGAGVERQQEHRVAVTLAGGPLPWLALQARAPFAFKTNVREPAGAGGTVRRSRGLGDAELQARVELRRFGSPVRSRVSIGVVDALGLPTGSNDVRDVSGQRLDAHLQPGTGAWSTTAGLAADLALPTTAFSASVLWRWNGVSGHGYHYGNALLANLGCARGLGAAWQATLELNARAAGRDRAENGGLDPDTGGSLLELAPGLRWAPGGAVAFDVLARLPVAQALHGVQAEHASARLGVTWARP